MANDTDKETKNQTLHDRLVEIQQTLNAPKNQINKFGNYNYRSCEDILGAVKPLLNGLALIISDEVVQIDERYYVQAIVLLSDGVDKVTATAYARESAEKKGMDSAQITGATSSYARKYALNGLFAIDDARDADAMDNRPEEAHKASQTAERKPSDAEEPPPPSDNDDSRVCSAHDEPVQMFRGVSKSKKDADGNWKVYWWHKNAEGKMCFGQGYQD